VRTLARHLIEERGHHRLVIDPAADNAAAIACYAKVGFRSVGVMRRYERDRGPGGVRTDGWHDGLLMDLLAEELM
jgi:aminoglycoside 6'-N-acetyltransferase